MTIKTEQKTGPTVQVNFRLPTPTYNLLLPHRYAGESVHALCKRIAIRHANIGVDSKATPFASVCIGNGDQVAVVGGGKSCEGEIRYVHVDKEHMYLSYVFAHGGQVVSFLGEQHALLDVAQDKEYTIHPHPVLGWVAIEVAT